MTATVQTLTLSATSIPFTGSSLSALANGTYVTSTSAVDLGTPTPLDDLLEIAVTVGSVAGNKQLLLFVKVSLDGVNFGGGPESGTSSADQTALRFIAPLRCPTSSGVYRDTFSLFDALKFCPQYYKPVVYNDTGAALVACSMVHSTVKGNSA